MAKTALEGFKKIIGLTEEEDFGVEEYTEDVSRKSKTKGIQSLRRGKEDIVVFEIKNSEEVRDVADCLKEKTSCFVNMQRCEPETQRNVINFLSGTVYALDGDIFPVGLKMYLCTPSSISAYVPEEVQKTSDSEADSSTKIIDKAEVFK